MGLRLGEALSLKVGDIDAERMKVHIRQAKGKKDRYTIHSLRHCYGTLLMEAGVGLRSIQNEMGHECPKTTQTRSDGAYVTP